MSSLRWVGQAPAVAQVSAATISGYDVTTTYSVSLGNYIVSQIGTGGTAIATATALVALLNSATAPQPFTEITWSNAAGASATITGTAKTAGVPFTATSSVSGGAGTFGAFSTSTASSGPNDWSTAANWDTNAIPVSTNDVYLNNTSDNILYGLAQSGVTLNSLNIALSFTGQLGLPKVNNSGALGYAEYRPDYLAISATTLNIGLDQGTGSALIKINTGANQTALNMYNSGQSATIGLEPVLWKGTHASNAVNVLGGQMGVAVYGDETATILTLRVSGNAAVRCSSGVTLATIDNVGGTIEVNGAFTTLVQTSGSFTIFGTGAVTTLQLNGGTVFYNTNGTCTTCNIESGATVDCSGDLRARTFTTTNLNQGGSINDPFRTVNWNGALNYVQCGLHNTTVNIGDHLTLAVTDN